MAILRDVTERLTCKGRWFDTVDSSEEVLIDHAKLDEDALGHCVDGAEHASELARA